MHCWPWRIPRTAAPRPPAACTPANAWDQNFLDWALDPARQSGDTGLVKNESSSTKGWHIMYFVGWNDPSWMYSVKTTLKSEDMTEWMDSLTAEAEVVQGSGISHIS